MEIVGLDFFTHMLYADTYLNVWVSEVKFMKGLIYVKTSREGSFAYLMFSMLTGPTCI